jgi:hypothetical protein
MAETMDYAHERRLSALVLHWFTMFNRWCLIEVTG